MICCGRINGLTFALTVCCLLWWKALVFWSGSWFRFPEFAWKYERVGGEGRDHQQMYSLLCLWSSIRELLPDLSPWNRKHRTSEQHLVHHSLKIKNCMGKVGVSFWVCVDSRGTAVCSCSQTREYRIETTWNFNSECFFQPLSTWWMEDNSRDLVLCSTLGNYDVSYLWLFALFSSVIFATVALRIVLTRCSRCLEA